MEHTQTTSAERPPIVAAVGHIDHGKSTLLDYIRKSNTVDDEAGGITQHLSAYEAVHRSTDGADHRITFLDTPGHEAFRAMRSRGLEVADVAILVVSAEDGVKPQTMEAHKLILEVGVPFIVALTKVDKPGADIERAKMSLLEHGIYLEGLGGEVPFVAISSKVGTGIPELLDLILLAAELEGLSADPSRQGSGLVIEAHVDPKRGNTATIIVQDGTVQSGEYIVCGESMAPVRIMENYVGRAVKEALPGSPVRVVGFSSLPSVGAKFKTIETKKEAEAEIADARLNRAQKITPKITEAEEGKVHLTLPIVIKTDFSGTGDAIEHELGKLPEDDRLEMRIVSRGVGTVTEGDVRLVGSGKHPGLIIGFNVKIEKEARDLADRLGVEIALFDIIYNITTWLAEQVVKHRPQQEGEEVTGSARVLKYFSTTGNRVVLGGRVETGTITTGATVRIMRAEVELGRGEILSLQTQKNASKKVDEGQEFGAMLRTEITPAPGDHIETFKTVLK